MKADVQRLEQLQSYERVCAPFSGVITARNTDIGALINEGAGGAQGLAPVPQELFHMAAVKMLRVYVAVPEVDSRAVQTGARAALTLDEFPGEKFQGTIARDSDSIDPSSRTLRVEVDIDNAQGRIRTGAYVFVHLKVPHSRQSPKSSVMVPSNTLLFRAEGLRVGVVRNGRAELVPIIIGRDFGATVEVVAGLRPTDQVIVNPSDSLTSGSPVQVSTPQTGGSR
jgi:RND family efflux transporter MFP subunit